MSELTMAGILGVEEPTADVAEESTTDAGTEAPDDTDQPQEPAADAEPDPAEPPAGLPEKWSLETIASVEEWTPELMAAAAQWMMEEEKRNATIAARAAKMDRKARQRRAQQESERRSWDVARDQMIADAQALRNGNAQQRLDALARVTGLTPDQVIEEITLGVAGDQSKRKTVDAETAARLERLERALQEREQREHVSVAEQRVSSELAMGVRDVERFPALAAAAEAMGHEEAAASLLGEMRRRAEAGQVLTVGDMLALADRAQARVGRPPAAAAPVTATKPATQSPGGRRPARTVPARLADTPSTSQRSETEEERLDRLGAMLGIL